MLPGLDLDDAGAIFSDDRNYRYRLWRTVSNGPPVTFVLLNPSTADEEKPDPTMRRVLGFAKSLGYGRVEVVNLFALCSPLPKVMMAAGANAVGPDNDRHIREALLSAASCVVAWGNDGMFRDRDLEVMRLIRESKRPARALRLTDANMPEHPLYLPADCTPLPYDGRAGKTGDVGTPSAAPEPAFAQEKPLPSVIPSESQTTVVGEIREVGAHNEENAWVTLRASGDRIMTFAANAEEARQAGALLYSMVKLTYHVVKGEMRFLSALSLETKGLANEHLGQRAPER